MHPQLRMNGLECESTEAGSEGLQYRNVSGAAYRCPVSHAFQSDI